MVKKKNTIPDGWRNVQPVGLPVPGTRFIGFKVPLKGVINNRLTPAQKFTPKDLIPTMKALNVELGLIIDLTYTTRYYDVKDLPKSIEYKKLFTVGHEVPDDATILQFKKWTRRFLWENADNDKLIGVHCSNGINRTGYLICRYLIDVEGWYPETAIQAFGEARGHQMDGKIYLADLRTQPMRSNLGMNLWDADGDVVSPQNDMDGHSDIFPNEECPRTGKRLRVYEDNHSDLPEQIGLREFDFINKGPGQRRKPYHDQGFQDDLQPLVQMKKRHFPEHPFYDDNQEEIPLKDIEFTPRELKDIEFTTRESERRLRPCHGHELCNDFPAGALPGDTNVCHGKRQSHSPDVLPHDDKLRDLQLRGSPQQQQQRPFYDLQSNNEYVRVKLLPNMQLKDLAFHSKRPGRRARQFLDCLPHDDVQLPMGDFEFVSRGHEQRIRLFNGHQYHTGLPGDDLGERDSESKCQPLCDHQSYDEDFLNGTPGQRLRSFNDHSPPKNNMAYEGYIERSDFPEDYRRVCPSNGMNGKKTRFAPYPSHPVHHLSLSQHEVDSLSVDHESESHHEMTTDTSQRKRLPVVIIDYNYGLPLDHITKEEATVHYDLHQGFSTYSPQAGSAPEHHFMWPTSAPEADADAFTTAVDVVYGSVYGRKNHQSSPLSCLSGHGPAHGLKRLRTPDLHSREHCVWK